MVFLALLMGPVIIEVVFFAIVGLVVAVFTRWFLKPYVSRKTRIVVAVVLGISLAYVPFWRVFPGMVLANYACQQEGGLRGEGPVAVDGYLRSTAIGPFDTSSIIDALVVQRYIFVEDERRTKVDRRWGTKSYENDQHDLLRSRAVVQGERYYRFYLSQKTDPACEGFNKWIESSHSNRTWVREKGLPESLCVASIRTDKPVSRHALEVERYTQNGFTSIEWVRYRVRAFPEGKSLREHRSFHYYALGASPMGAFHGAQTYCHIGKEIVTFLNESLMPRNSMEIYEWQEQSATSARALFYSSDRDRPTTIDYPVPTVKSKKGNADRLKIRPSSQWLADGDFYRMRNENYQDDRSGNIDFRRGDVNSPGDPWHKYQSLFLVLNDPTRTRKVLVRADGMPPGAPEVRIVVVSNSSITALLQYYAKDYGQYWIVKYSLDGQLLSAIEFEVRQELWEKGPLGLVKSLKEKDGKYYLTFLNIREKDGGRVVRNEHDYEVIEVSN